MGTCPQRAARRGDHGFVLPSWVAVASLALVVVAIVAFFVTGGLGGPDETTRNVTDPGLSQDIRHDKPSADVGRSNREKRQTSQRVNNQQHPGNEHHAKRQQRNREPRHREPAQVPEAYVEVYNNSAIAGLAAQTAAELQDAGWQVVGTDNWYGNIPASTVYFPDRLQDQAQLLASAIGVERILPAVDPMRFDRLTVILTDSA